MTERSYSGWAEITLWIVATIWISFVVGFSVGGDFVRSDAIRHGSAMEYVDEVTGETRFEWK